MIPRTRIQDVHVLNFLGFDLGVSFDSIFPKLDRMVGTMDNWSSIVFGQGELGIAEIQELLENGSLTTYFAGTQQFDNMLWYF